MRKSRRQPTQHLGILAHDRNRYKNNPPDFYALGQQYIEFKQYLSSIDDVTCRASLSWDDPFAVRELTKTLLLHDFGLQWDIPIHRLCPPLPNRLNYLHWVEDLLAYHTLDSNYVAQEQEQKANEKEVYGVDVGTGASCIYALLGAAMNKWRFIATEIDAESYACAKENVARNHLETHITVKQTHTNKLLFEPLQDEPLGRKFHFVMCNPPFFDNMDEADTNPASSCMGSANEMVFPGGEVAFIGHMITESVELQSRILWFTSMVGRKASLRKLLALLREKNVQNIRTTEFFQGRTKRWGIAWTFAQVNVIADSSEKVLGKRKEAHRRQQLSFHVLSKSKAANGCATIDEVVSRVQEFVETKEELKLSTISTNYQDEEKTNDQEYHESQRYRLDLHKPNEHLSDNNQVKVHSAGQVKVSTLNDSVGGFQVFIDFETGDRAAFWTIANMLQAATVRTGRQWRRKLQRLKTHELSVWSIQLQHFLSLPSIGATQFAMVMLEICGIPVEFPFSPYDSQIVYMEKVILALMSKQNAILESPTGTGKTLCLLCATLAWRRQQQKILGSSQVAASSAIRAEGLSLAYEGYDREKETSSQLPRIIYSSRTHSQLKQVVQELKNTSYCPNIAVLGSREHLCVNDTVAKLQGTRQNLACRSTCKDRKCMYKLGFDSYAKRSKQQAQPIMDIEELVTTMKEKTICPFFLTRSLLPEAEIVFVPYNYLIDPLARRSIGISIENSILIFDEAHNVESIASEAASYTLSSNDISGCIAEVDKFISGLLNKSIPLNAGSSLTMESVQTLRALFVEIDKGLNTFTLSPSGGFTQPGEYIFKFFEQFNVNFETCPLVLSMIEEIVEVTHGEDDSQRAVSKLDTMLSFFGTIFRNKETHLTSAKHYRVHIQEIQERPSNAGHLFHAGRRKKTTTRVLNYWCFHPGVSFREICTNNVHNVILTSGTLSPLNTTVKELGIDFPVRLENNHVVDADQVWVGVVGTGVTGKRLNSSYNFRSTETYLLELGNTIVNFTRLVPHGLLVFFPSYSILEENIDRWQKPAAGESSLSIWERIVQHKQTFVEPRGRAEFKAVVDEYHQTITDNPKGAVFFAVSRGKVSEGIDFSNDKGRAVVITGLPFPPTKDPKIVLKKSILDEAVVSPGEMKLTGNAWYIQQASRAVNQAIGRVIRHRHDYGAIILLDERFALKQQQECLSKWLQPYCHVCRGYGEAHIGLTRFFKGNKARAVPESLVKKFVQQPKSIGLSSKKTFSMVSKALPGQEDSQTSLNASQLSNYRLAIGIGQSYVNPQLLRHQPDMQTEVPNLRALQDPGLARPVCHPKKRSLGSLLMSTSKSAMVDTTSSISRPFTGPKMANSGSSADSAIVVDDDGAQLWQNAEQHFATNTDAAKSEKYSANMSTTTTFPAVARKVLQPSDVPKLYSFIRQLQAGEDVELSLSGICNLLRSRVCKELLELMPKVLHGEICEQFIEAARSHGLEVSGCHKAQQNSNEMRSSNMSTLFERLQQKRKKTHDSNAMTAAVVKDPQCFVCYDIARKAYASPQCGHICCQSCWKKMEMDGFTSCPVCKVPIKLQQLSLIRAAKESSRHNARVDNCEKGVPLN